jgi:hypothetical protein
MSDEATFKEHSFISLIQGHEKGFQIDGISGEIL